MTEGVAVPDAPGIRVARAEELFNLFKSLALHDAADGIPYVREPLKIARDHNFSYSQTLSCLKKLAALGALDVVKVHGGYGVGSRIAAVRLLKDAVSVPLGKPGRKPKLIEPMTVPEVKLEVSLSDFARNRQLAIARALNSRHHQTKAEQLFYFLKILAKPDGAGRLVVENPLGKIRKWFPAPYVYKLLDQLESSAALQKVMGGWRDRETVEVRFLKEDISVLRKESGRKKLLKVSPVEKAVPKPAPVPVAESIAVKKTLEGAIAFIDLENALITAQQIGARVDIVHALHKIRVEVMPDGQPLLRMFLYYSEATERGSGGKEISSMLGLESDTLRFVKAPNGPDSVDKRIKEDIGFFLKLGFGGTFIIGTNDGGEHFSEAIDSIKNSNKRAVLVTLAGSTNVSLANKVDTHVKAVPENPRSAIFREIIRSARYHKPLSRKLKEGSDADFLSRVSEELLVQTSRSRRFRFSRLVESIWGELAASWVPRGYSQDDCREAISSINKNLNAFYWDMMQGFKEYYLNSHAIGTLKSLSRPYRD